MKFMSIAVLGLVNLMLGCGAPSVSSDVAQSKCSSVVETKTFYNICQGYGKKTVYHVKTRTKTTCSAPWKVTYSPWVVKSVYPEGISALCP